MAIGALAYLVLLNLAIATDPDPRCSQTLDEMNCVNASIGDLPSVPQATAKDLKFLESALPILKNGDLVNFPELTDFVCLDCQIIVIEKDAFWNLTNLLRIELYGNNLNFLDKDMIKNCRKLKDFIIAWNPTLVVPEDGPFLISSSLLSLDLTGNEISNLSSSTFSELPALKSLVLAGNGLRHLCNEVFAPLKNLRFLDLSRNKFTGISLSVFPNRLSKVKLSWNPWHCSCALYPVMQWSRTRQPDDIVRCYRPHRIKWHDFPGHNCTSEMVDAIRERKMTAIPDKPHQLH